MNTLRMLCVTAALLAATACSHKEASEPPAQQPAGVIPPAQLDALNKAKNVESTLMQADQKQREQIDKEDQ